MTDTGRPASPANTARSAPRPPPPPPIPSLSPFPPPPLPLPPVPLPPGSGDPERDIRAFEAELLLHDLGIIERRLEKLDIIGRSGPHAEREAAEREKHLLERCKRLLDEEKPLRGQIDDAQDRKA